MERYSLYLFDFDLTLVETRDVIVKCFHKTMAEMGFARNNDKELARLIGLPMQEAVGIALNTQDKEIIAHFCRTYTVVADRYMTAGTHFYPETLPALQKLKESGAKIGIVSSKTASRIEEKLQQSHCQHLIDHVLGCQEVAAHKPDPEGLLKALEYFGVPKEDTLYTGDNLVDAQAAEAAGLDFAAVLTGNTSSYAFQGLPHRAIVPNVGHIPHILKMQ
jgi:phosphoglycolate phosphatase